jgi:hypothetical protein
MEPYGSSYQGLDITAFWQQMEHCFASLFADPNPDRHLRPDEALIPTITLDPPPQSWPDPSEFEEDDTDHE